MSDLDPAAQDWIKPFIAHHWPRYEVRFPTLQRTVEIAYASGNSASLRAALAGFIEAGRITLLVGKKAKAVTPDQVVLNDGTVLSARAVIDARGQRPGPHVLLGYQKFVGQVLSMKAPHGLEHPVIMDATVDQMGGYRFVYCLPYSPTCLLVEDTYYTDNAALAEDEVIERINAYVAAQGWQVSTVERTERGILPITLASDLNAALADEKGKAPTIGLAAGLFNATTGYSLPDAVRLADLLATKLGEQTAISPAPLAAIINDYRTAHWQRERFYRLLNRMLFKAAKPEQRYKVLQRFYHLNEGLIARFYASSLTKADKLRILSGKPPVPVGAALYNYAETPFMKRHRRSM